MEIIFLPFSLWEKGRPKARDEVINRKDVI
jgi:hypothetical protein